MLYIARREGHKPSLRQLPAMKYASLIAIFVLSIPLSQARTTDHDEELITILTILITLPDRHVDLNELPLNTFVVDSDAIDKKPSSNVSSIIANIPSVFTDRTGSRGAHGSVYLHGGDPNFTTVRIDGVQVNNPTNSRGGSFEFGSLDAAEIERIEVLNGPLSALYGSDAMAGAVNIFTKQIYSERRFDLDAGLGETGYEQLSIHAVGSLTDDKRRFYSLSGGYVDEGKPVEGDTFVGRTLSFKYSSDSLSTSTFRTGFRHQEYEATTFPDDSGGPRLSVIRDVDEIDVTSSIAYVKYAWQGRMTEHNFNLNGYRVDQHAGSPGISPGIRDPFGIPPNTTDDDYGRYELLLNSKFLVNENLATTLGLDVDHESGKSRGQLTFQDGTTLTTFDLTRTTVATVVGLRYIIAPGMTVHGALRYTKPESLDPEVIPTVGILLRLDSVPVIFRANWGEGFKLPSFFALGNPIVGNPDVKPESSEGFEFYIEYQITAATSLSISTFTTHYHDLIDIDTTPPPKLVNRSNVDARGGEFILRTTAMSNLTSSLYLSYTDTNVRGSEESLRNRPRYRAGLNLEWAFNDDIELNTDVSFVGERLDSSVPTGDRTLDAFTRVDISGRWRLSKQWVLSAAIDNLFDKSYEDAIGFPAASRRFKFTIGFVH